MLTYPRERGIHTDISLSIKLCLTVRHYPLIFQFSAFVVLSILVLEVTLSHQLHKAIVKIVNTKNILNTTIKLVVFSSFDYMNVSKMSQIIGQSEIL